MYTAAGKLAASSSSPGNEDVMQYNPDHQAFMWTASAQWSLLFTAQETAVQFEGNTLCTPQDDISILLCRLVFS